MNQYSKSTNFLDDIFFCFLRNRASGASFASPRRRRSHPTDSLAHWTGAVCVCLFERSHGAVVGELGSLFLYFTGSLSAVNLPELGVQEPEKLVSGSFFTSPIMVGMPPLNDTWDNIPLLQDANLPVAFDANSTLCASTLF